MLIYNYKKEFLGIDESDLLSLGLSDLAELRNEAADFADLFVKTPGHIHNFKHVHWIDYITCNDTGVAPKAVINVKGKSYTTDIDIKTIYLVDNPSQKAYIVNLSSLRPLSGAQSEKISADLVNRTAPQAATGAIDIPTTLSSTTDDFQSNAAYDPYETDDIVEPSAVVEDIYESQTPTDDKFATDAPLDLDYVGEDLQAEEYVEPSPEVVEMPVTQAPSIEETKLDENDPFATYVYNPQVASEELGLPIDLVEEFIQDFIAQANSFRDVLYEATKNAEFDKVRIESHKLKGVAANLRIEDALDALTIVNSSDNLDEVKTNLDRLYRIVNKLSNKGNVDPSSSNEDVVVQEEEDDFVLSIKDDDIQPMTEEQKQDEVVENDISIAENATEVDDAEVPVSIEMPELEDDDFLKTEILENNIDESELSILDEEASDIEQEEVQEQVLDIAVSYDKEMIANEIGLDIDSFNELFDDYINESKELTNGMGKSIADADLNGLKGAAIKLKGMSENMRIHKFDDELETMINASTTDEMEDSLQSIVSKLAQISNTEDK